MGLCAEGPLVSTETGTLYQHVAPADAGEILDSLEASPVDRLVCRTDVPFFQRQKKIVLENSGVVDPERVEEYVGASGYGALINVLTEMAPSEVVQEVVKSGLRGTGRGRLSHGAEVEHGGEGCRAAEVRHLQCRRRRSRRFHGSQRPRERSASRARRHADRRLCRGCFRRLHLRARRISAGHQAPAHRHPPGRAHWPARHQHLRDALQFPHRFAAWAPAPLFAEKRPRSSPRWKAAAARLARVRLIRRRKVSSASRP